MPALLQLQNYQVKGMESGKKVSLHRFLADQKCILGHASYSTSNKLLLVATHSDYRPPKMTLKLAV